MAAAAHPEGAEVSNLEIVRHYYDGAVERLGLPDDVRTVFWTSYRELTVQIPVKLSDGQIHTYSGRAKEEKLPLRGAAYLLGIERVVEASRARGYI
ncbi:MAG: hypothetical protein EXQ70_02880 [Solirubrobacterales bacterium]|nr:hypothetical protein [Solirubrobacterales bacterium]